MSLPLHDQEIEQLCQQFKLPQEIIYGVEHSNGRMDINEYDLHEYLCELHPEDAVLCITLCLNKLIKHKDVTPPLKNALSKVTNTLLEQYGHRALMRINPNSENSDREEIQQVAKDLSFLSRRLETLEPIILDIPNDDLVSLFSALCIQAGAQTEIARFVLSNQKHTRSPSKRPPTEANIPFMKTLPVNDNR